MYYLAKIIAVSWNFVFLFNLIIMVGLKVANFTSEKVQSEKYKNLYSYYDGIIIYIRTFERFNCSQIYFLVFGE